MLLTRLFLFACFCLVSQAWGALILSTNPGSATVGGQSFTLAVNLAGTGAPAPKPTWAVRWNGSVRPTMVATSGQVSATIAASDIALPGFAEITIVDQATGVVYPATAWVLIAADIDVSDFAYDSVRNRFYVSVPTGSPRPGAPAESVVAVDAATGTLLSSISVGSKPTLMAISDDASYLYVYASGSSLIRRIALSSFTPDVQINLPGQGYLSWMQVQPGAPRTLAVAQQSTGSIGTGGLTVYDDATARTTTAAGAPSRFVFTDAQTIAGYTYLPNINSYGIQAWKVGSSGIAGSPATIANTTGPPVAYGDGWILCGDGHVIDPTGARATQQLDLSGVGAFVPGQNRLLMLSYGSGGANPVLGAYEDTAMDALGRLQTNQPYNSYPVAPVRMLVWGSDGVAFVANNQLFIGHTELAAAAPSFPADGIVNSATLTTGNISPGEIVSIFGSNLGTAQGRGLEFSEPRQVSTDLAETQVWFDGLPGTLLYAGSGQINVVAPFELAGKTSTRVQVWYEGIPSVIVPMQISAASPGLFTQDGSGKNASATVNADGTLNTPTHPAPAGSFVSLFGTGGGETQPSLADGQQDIYASSLTANVQVVLNGSALPTLYAGSAPSLVAGVIQINFLIPQNFPPSAAASVQLSVGGILSPSGVTISTK